MTELYLNQDYLYVSLDLTQSDLEIVCVCLRKRGS